jgi:transcriptional regulator with XRE-family HTH domain
VSTNWVSERRGGNIACWLNSTVNCKQSFFADAFTKWATILQPTLWKQQSSAQERLHKERQADVNERSKMISKLIKGRDTRESYIRSKLSVLLPAQIRSLRLSRGMKQAELGAEAEMKQGRISVLERIGEVSFSIETLIKLAAAFRVGLIVKFAPMSEMLNWENGFQPDTFDVIPVENDTAFVHASSPGNREQPNPRMILAMIGSATNTTTEGTLPVKSNPAYYKVNASDFAMGSILGYGENSQTPMSIWPAVEPSNQISNGVAA